jgi:hypothetical protein
MDRDTPGVLLGIRTSQVREVLSVCRVDMRLSLL